MSTLNVVRYTALVSGILYGIVHRSSLQKAADLKKEHEHEHQIESWIAQAKKEYAKKLESKKAGPIERLLGSSSQKSSLVTDPEDPKFDLEKLIAHWEANEAKA